MFAVALTTAARAESPVTHLATTASLRLRAQFEQFESASDRFRLRLRGRVGAIYEAAPGLDVGARLSTGSDDPTSSQLTLGDEFNGQPLKVDRLYMRLRYGSWLEVMAGKVPAVFRNRRLIWDRDVAPEGLNEAVTFGCPDGLEAHAILGQFVLLERDASSRDVLALVGQAGVTMRRGRYEIAFDLAAHDYPNVSEVILTQRRGSNAVDADGRLVNEYRLVDGLLEVTTRLSSISVEVFVELARNVGTGVDSDALAVGLAAASIRPGLRVGYEFRRVEREAILDALAESAWYVQRTGFLGHKLSVKRVIKEMWTLGSSVSWMRALEGSSSAHLDWSVDLEWAL